MGGKSSDRGAADCSMTGRAGVVRRGDAAAAVVCRSRTGRRRDSTDAGVAAVAASTSPGTGDR